MREQRTFRAVPAEVSEVRRFVSQCAGMASLSDVLPDLLIAASEAAANAILHSGTKEFRVTWRSTRERVEITVEDDGIFLDTVPLPEIDGIGHRGISLMAATMDELSLIEGRRDRPGTRVRLVKVLRRAGKDSRRQDEVGRQASRSPA